MCSVLIVLVCRHEADPGPPPVESTCRQIAQDPARFAGRRVLVKTDGCEPDGNGRLIWRPFHDGPPQVILLVEPGRNTRVAAGYCHWSGTGPPVVYARRD